MAEVLGLAVVGFGAGAEKIMIKLGSFGETSLDLILKTAVK